MKYVTITNGSLGFYDTEIHTTIPSDAYKITNQTSTGFTISFKDNTGTAVAREINWVAIGW